ncbi:MAG: hypothetical protein AABX11_05605 [Nanoarchaeota archaeon]
MKVLILDSGPIINFSMNGLLYLFEKIKKELGVKILITPQVKEEVVNNPLKVKRFEFEALQIQSLIEKGILELPASIDVSDKVLEEETNAILDKANHFLQAKGKWIKIVSPGEMSCLALSDECTRKGIANIIGVDERTTRLLAEKPENLEQLMSERLHQRVQLVAPDYKIFSKYKFVRSSELVFVAYKKNLMNVAGNKILEAALYATKFKGAAISFEEIDEMKKL